MKDISFLLFLWREFIFAWKRNIWTNFNADNMACLLSMRPLKSIWNKQKQINKRAKQCELLKNLQLKNIWRNTRHCESSYIKTTLSVQPFLHFWDIQPIERSLNIVWNHSPNNTKLCMRHKIQWISFILQSSIFRSHTLRNNSGMTSYCYFLICFGTPSNILIST